MMKSLNDQLLKSQERMKHFASKQRTERHIVVGDMVYLKLKPYRQTFVGVRKNLKLSSRYYGPFAVLEKIGSVAYRLALPLDYSIHPIFHVFQLKHKLIDAITPSPTLPLVNAEGQILIEPVAILDGHIVNRNNMATTQILVQ